MKPLAKSLVCRNKRDAIASAFVLSVIFSFTVMLTVPSQAQQALPTASPTATVDPLPTASPTPTPETDPAPYLPTSATVKLGVQENPTIPVTQTESTARPKSSAPSARATLPAQVLQLSSSEMFAPTGLAVQPQLASVTFSYNISCAGAKVLVAPLDGGTINGVAGASTVTVGVDGSLTFTFQAPAGPGRYHVVTRLGRAEMSMPFDVASPSPTPAVN